MSEEEKVTNNIGISSQENSLADHNLDGKEEQQEDRKVPDWRHITNGSGIPTENYSDQPYIIKTDDGAWLCVMTTGSGHEGQSGQHVVTLRSTDKGKTWSDPVDVEPADGPEASYAVLLKVSSGRIYCFYNHNTDNIRKVKAENPPYADGYCYRVDSLGYYVFKYSDDHGRSWSEKRYPIPVREMEIDRENAYGGDIRFFWNVGKPFVYDDAAFVSLHKVGGFGEGFFTRSEGVLLRSENILTEDDPEKITWETLPEGDKGLRTPPGGGPIAEEHSYSILSDGTFFSVYRSIDGHSVCAYSRDQGRTWTEPEYMHYTDGRLLKHPRAANFAWKCNNGKYLYWFHNHGGTWYEDRNPVWFCCGVEEDTPEGKIIKWSQPEIAIYDDDPYVRMSYPDLIEEEGNIYVTETQKDMARVHNLDDDYLEKFFNQFENNTVTEEGLMLEIPDGSDGGNKVPAAVSMPELPDFLERDTDRADYGTKDLRQGFTIELWLKFTSLEPEQIILDARSENGQGLCLKAVVDGMLEIILNDSRTENRWTSDPGVLKENKYNQVAVVVDGGPKIINFIINGTVCDGGKYRQFGWGRFSPDLRHVNGADQLTIAPNFNGEIGRLRLYDRYLMTSEVIGNYRGEVDLK